MKTSRTVVLPLLLSLLLAAPLAAAPRPLGGPEETVETAVAEAEAAAQSTRMRVQVSAVGVGISATSAAAIDLRAIAEAGGGRYVAAEQADQLSAALAQAVGGGAPAVPSRGKVALLPAVVFRGDVRNGVLVSDALRRHLQDAGFEVSPAAGVDDALRTAGIDLRLPQSLARIGEVGRSLGAAFVVYPRSLAIGKPLSSKIDGERVLTVLVNVVDTATGRGVHTFQAGAPFVDKDDAPESIVPPEALDAAAARLLAGFLKR